MSDEHESAEHEPEDHDAALQAQAPEVSEPLEPAEAKVEHAPHGTPEAPGSIPPQAAAVAKPEGAALPVEAVAVEPEHPSPPSAPAPEVIPVLVLSSLRPGHGPIAGGNEVTLAGDGFAEVCEVTFGDMATTVTRESAKLLRVIAPARSEAGHVDVAVAHGEGQLRQEARIADAYRYDAAPLISGFAPPCLSTEGGDVLTILGGEFIEGAVVRIGDVIVPSSFANPGRLEAVTQRRAAGSAEVSVENPDGQRATRATAVLFVAPPRIDAVVPSSVRTTGGTEVKISGKGFEAGAAVLVADVRVAVVNFVSEGELRFAAPARVELGAVDISVVNPAGLTTRAPGALTFVKAPPLVESVAPDAGPSAGGTPLVVRGSGFDEGLVVLLCGVEANVTWRSAEELLVTTPEVARDGLVDLRVVNPDDQAHVMDRAFRYHAALRPPQLTAIGAARGSQLGGLEVALLGEDFAEGCTVRFGGTPAKATFLTHKELRVVTPPHVGFGGVAVEVTNPDGATSVLEGAFTYDPKPAPEIVSLTPTSGPTTGGTRVVIEGRNFTKESAVYFGREHPKDISVKSAIEIVVVTAARKQAGVVDVEVALPGAPHGVAKNGFRFDAVPAPTITSVTPSAGSPGGGTEMSVTGKNFTKETAVLVGGKPPKAVKLVDAGTLELKTPPGDAGKMVDVVVRNPDGKEATQKRAFLYDPRYR